MLFSHMNSCQMQHYTSGLSDVLKEEKIGLPRLLYPGSLSLLSLSIWRWVLVCFDPAGRPTCLFFDGAEVAGFWVSRGLQSRGSPSPPSPGNSSASGQEPSSWRWGKCLWHAGLGAQGHQRSSGGAFSRGFSREAVEGWPLRLPDGTSRRYAGRLVPGSLQAAAAAARLKAWPYRRAKQLLCKQTTRHRHIWEALRAPREHLSGAGKGLRLTEWREGGPAVSRSLSRGRCRCIWRWESHIRQ